MRIFPMLALWGLSLSVGATDTSSLIEQKANTTAAAEKPAVEKKQEAPAAVMQTLKRMVKLDMKQVSVNASPVPNLYEALIGSEVVYISADGKYVFVGDLRDASTGVNLTENKRGEVRKTSLAAVKEEDMIIFPAKGDNLYTITVFTDVDCGYCAKLHQEVPKLNTMGVTVRYLAFPRAGIGSESYNKMVSVWCSKDRQQAITDSKKGIDVKPTMCDNPVEAQFELGRMVGVAGTPAIVLQSGEVLPGYMPAEKLVAYLQQKTFPVLGQGVQVKP